jgi:hypothetical protein
MHYIRMTIEESGLVERCVELHSQITNFSVAWRLWP